MKEKIKRKMKMQVYLTQEEFEQIAQSSKSTALSISTFARKVCLGSKVVSMEDVMLRRELRKLAADLGRLGGLFKLALTEEQEEASLMRKILKDIEENKELLKSKIRELES